MEFSEFCLLHSVQLTASCIPEHLWPALHRKLENEIFDAGDYFSMWKVEADEGDDDDAGSWRVTSTHENTISVQDLNCVFLVDHAWTFRINEARKQLEQVPSLLTRMTALMDIERHPHNEGDVETAVEAVLNRMWKYTQTYSVSASELDIESSLPVWYVMDEFGSHIAHNSEPSARCVPFYFIPTGTTFSVLFLVHDLAPGEELTRDYAESSLRRKHTWKPFYLLPWQHEDFSHLDFNFLLPDDAFYTTGRHNERMPVTGPTDRTTSKPSCLRVYSEYEKINENLKHPRFRIVEERDDADVWWLRKHYTAFDALCEGHPDTIVNQFPNEGVLTVKDLLAACVHTAYANPLDRETLEPSPAWFQATYNLDIELPQFVSYFQNRAKKGLDNHWIIKPYNLARSLDTHVSNDVGCIIRLIESGPKIACKYIDKPVLFYRDDIDAEVKFDMRFIVLLRSVKPVCAYVYDRFWLRFAAKPFALDHLDDYEQHFTVMNYTDSCKIKQMFCSDFVKEFCRQYPEVNWETLKASMYAAIKEALLVASREAPPKGVAHNEQSRAMYGIDLMLKWTTEMSDDGTQRRCMQPVILEFNFMPDCERACNYYPDFMNTVFDVLFIDESEGGAVERPVTLL